MIVALGPRRGGGGYLFATVAISVVIGTAYSLPPIRLKRFAVWASACILVVRGVVVNLGLFLYFAAAQQSPGIPPIIWALTGFVVVFSVAIAIFKDIPDIEGDRQYNIRTFTVRLGQRTVFNLARGLLTLAYRRYDASGSLAANRQPSRASHGPWSGPRQLLVAESAGYLAPRPPADGSGFPIAAFTRSSGGSFSWNT
ncbi:Homogentisate phytyltransferase [Halomicronema hongdechloris C2206]|uniref:Homogentisate phytyltransferase n=1 Tax=Halomicronema hongdechloris C2206 TaxID=1641165 RepID=A0A1Z3HRP3_9CYAN|nr:Homogentisate phytyltransferase [Halomicronema hongdechloris C2206]